MAKQGMKRISHDHDKNHVPPVPEIQGKAKSGKLEAPSAITRGEQSYQVFRNIPHAVPGDDDDLASENLADALDLTAADIQDL